MTSGTGSVIAGRHWRWKPGLSGAAASGDRLLLARVSRIDGASKRA
ncbi:hypothetical protein KVC_0866 [Ketogulonicigenium vulgare]|nr:hypothetical protein KVC_0866 [Ketogulonicigenium vulgare]